MRVIAGRAKGHRLKGPPPGHRGGRSRGGRPSGARPTSDMVRGAIFSALASLGADMSRTLDLYAGSGALGIEALSRGAFRCDFLERDAAACAVIRENLAATGFQEQASVLCLPVERALDRLEGPFTLVLADPPYDDTRAIAALGSLLGGRLVEIDKTVAVLEHSARQKPLAQLGRLSLLKVLRHGDSAVSIYR